MAIRILPQNLVNQIAAGEVVERPASALKELIENSLDAGATRIDVIARDGGKAYMCVADNGCGMSRSDLCRAILRHATSKLPEDDLKSIAHLGFRGEAVPSIASVSRMKITTNDGLGGWEISINGGAASEVKPAAAEQGTRVEVAELFYNVPARLKFLKTSRGEAAAIMDVVERMALSYPEVEFSLNEAIRFAPADRLARSRQILGPEFRDEAVAVDQTLRGVRVSGFVARPGFTASTSASQYFFVNGRSVKDKQLFQAVRAAYMDTMERGRFAACALWIDLDPAEVDVNVHPQKAEVRFRDSEAVRSAVIKTIREALASAGIKTRSARADLLAAHVGARGALAVEERQRGFGEAPSVNPAEVSSSGDEELLAYPLGAARGLVHNTYIIAQTAGGMAIIDMHAAHERIVYEKLKGRKVERQMLLIPEVVELGERRAAQLLEMADELAAFGLVIEPFGDAAVAVREAPALLGKADMGAIVRDLAEVSQLEDRLAHVAKTYGCHTSIRSGATLNAQEMNALLRQIENCPNAGQCNHGRPAYVEIPMKDINKLFDR